MRTGINSTLITPDRLQAIFIGPSKVQFIKQRLLLSFLIFKQCFVHLNLISACKTLVNVFSIINEFMGALWRCPCPVSVFYKALQFYHINLHTISIGS